MILSSINFDIVHSWPSIANSNARIRFPCAVPGTGGSRDARWRSRRMKRPPAQSRERGPPGRPVKCPFNLQTTVASSQLRTRPCSNATTTSAGAARRQSGQHPAWATQSLYRRRAQQLWTCLWPVPIAAAGLRAPARPISIHPVWPLRPLAVRAAPSWPVHRRPPPEVGQHAAPRPVRNVLPTCVVDV